MHIKFRWKIQKVLFDEDMIKSNRTFTITKLKNNLKTVDSFIANENKDLIILTSIGRILTLIYQINF